MPWDYGANRWTTVLAPRCLDCGRIDWLDFHGRCSLCELYTLPADPALVKLPVMSPIPEEEWLALSAP